MRFRYGKSLAWLCSMGCLSLLAGCQTAPDCFEDGGVTICNGLPRPSGTGTGTILTFTADKAPVAQVSGTTEELNNVTFGGGCLPDAGLFVAVGAAGVTLDLAGRGHVDQPGLSCARQVCMAWPTGTTSSLPWEGMTWLGQA